MAKKRQTIILRGDDDCTTCGYAVDAAGVSFEQRGGCCSHCLKMYRDPTRRFRVRKRRAAT